MNKWLGALMRVILFYPQLYPGYVPLGGTQGSNTPKIAVGFIWIFVVVCVSILVVVFILLWRDTESKRRAEIDNQERIR